MMMKVAGLVLTLFVCGVLSAADISSIKANGWFPAKREWTRVKEAPLEMVVEVQVGLRMRNTDRLERIVLEVSDPKSPKYGQYYTVGELRDIVAPPQSDVDEVVGWLNEVRPLRVNVEESGDLISVKLTVKQLSNLFMDPKPTFYIYSHPRMHHLIRTEDPVFIPDEVHRFVHVMHGIDHFPFVKESPEEIRLRKLQEKREAWELENEFLLRHGPCAIEGKPHIEQITTYSGFIQVIPSMPAGMCPEVAAAVEQWELAFSLDMLGNYTIVQRQNISHEHVVELTGVPSYQIGYLRVRYVKGNETSEWSDFYDAPIVNHDIANPNWIRQYYGVPSGLVGQGENEIGNMSVLELGGFWDADGVAYWWSQLGVNNSQSLLSAGDPRKGVMGGEQQLDIETMTGVAPFIPAFFDNNQDSVFGWLANIAADPTTQLVHSASWIEFEPHHMTPEFENGNLNLQKLASRGRTILNGAGDWGAFDGDCFGDVSVCFPSSSPYCTSVAATRPAIERNAPYCTTPWDKQQNAGRNAPIVCPPTSEQPVSPETGSLFTTGGAFSFLFPQPSWQQAFVQKYLNNSGSFEHFPPAERFNASGRGFADVTLFGSQFYTYSGEDWVWNGGTSASTPTTGALIALANSLLLRNGKPPLGLPGPLFYQLKTTNPDVFNQISNGNNRCNGWWSTMADCCPYGFSAWEGEWSPVAGLGSLNFGNFLLYLLQQQ